MSRLTILMGCPGVGKSTLAHDMFRNGTDRYISRDVIRFSMVNEEEAYFSKEKDVFHEFVAQIDSCLAKGYTVWADATHISKASRLKLLRALKVKPDVLEIIWVKAPLEVALKQNEYRRDTRGYVPPSAIERMYNSLEAPSYQEEEFHYDSIFIKEDDNFYPMIEEDNE